VRSSWSGTVGSRGATSLPLLLAVAGCVVHAGIILFDLGYEFDFTALVLVGVAGLFYYSGVLLAHAERN
jgi:hypothetical protein